MRVTLFALFLMSLQLSYSQTQNDEQLIRKARHASNEAIAQKDIEGISKFWLDDFVIIRGSGVIETGKEKAIATWKK